MTLDPLWRNRDFVLLQTGQLLSTFGGQMSSIAYPLLTLGLTGSPAKAGLVAFLRLVPALLFSIPAGLLADRYDRRRLMLAADAVRALVHAGLAAAILVGAVELWLILAAGFVQGAAWTVFHAAESGALKAVVPTAQLPAAVGAVEARMSTVRLLGPSAGGALYGLGRSVPFVVDSLSYAFSFLSLALMKTPFQEQRERDAAPVRTQIADGFRFLWQQPFVRTTTLLFGIGNFSIPGMLLVLIVVAEERLTAGQVGLVLAVFGAGTLVGAFASGLFRRTFGSRTIMLLEFWAGLLAVGFVLVPSVWVLLAALTLQGVTLPITNSVVHSFRLAVIPDRLVGRVETASHQLSLLIAPLGPLAAGLLLSATSPRVTVACFLAFSAALVVWGVLSPALKDAPNVRDLDVYAQTG